MSNTVLVLAPHPDDAEFYAGGLLAKMALEGSRIILATVTDGSKGSYEYDGAALVKLRRVEAEKGAAVLGAQPPIMLNHVDMELDQLPAGKLRAEFIGLIRKYQPDVLVAEDVLDFNEPHPDHRCVARAAAEAVQFASLPLIHPEHLQEGFPAHFVPEKYFYSENPGLFNRIIDISGTFPIKMAALAQHASQVSFLVEDIVRQAQMAGLNLGELLGEAAGDPLAAFTWAMQMQAGEVGQRAGYTLGEGFRYVRFHPFVENMLGKSSFPSE